MPYNDQISSRLVSFARPFSSQPRLFASFVLFLCVLYESFQTRLDLFTLLWLSYNNNQNKQTNKQTTLTSQERKKRMIMKSLLSCLFSLLDNDHRRARDRRIKNVSFRTLYTFNRQCQQNLLVFRLPSMLCTPEFFFCDSKYLTEFLFHDIRSSLFLKKSNGRESTGNESLIESIIRERMKRRSNVNMAVYIGWPLLRSARVCWVIYACVYVCIFCRVIDAALSVYI